MKLKNRKPNPAGGAKMKFDSLQDKVVVITGASSGIGKLATEELLKLGAKVVMAARSLKPMQQHLHSLRADESRALAVAVDVSDYRQVEYLAEQAIDHFGKVDVWINNAAVSIYGPLETLPPDEVSHVIDVNLKGQFYGSQEAIKIFKAQGYGNLMNISSALGKASTPLQSAYTASKHGIVGFSSCLREELIHDSRFRNIDVSVILPSSMDTPLFRHARSTVGVEPYPIPPIYDARLCVREIIRCAMDPRPEIVPGRAGGTLVWAYRLFPNLLERYMAKTAVKQQLTRQPKRAGEDNLYKPMPGVYGVSGGIGTTGEHLRNLIKIAAVLLPILLLASLFSRQRSTATGL
jgi:NAD(P)-dependent dehydrogenase (short-subunit alcohol dehydrogenase family)